MVDDLSVIQEKKFSDAFDRFENPLIKPVLRFSSVPDAVGVRESLLQQS